MVKALGKTGVSKDQWQNQWQYGPQRHLYQQILNNQHGNAGMFGGIATQFGNCLGDV